MTEPRRWITFVEIDVSVCSLTYGTGACEAVLGTAEDVEAGTATGTRKCFNMRGTCQDRANYAETFKTLRFVEDVGYQRETGIEAIPSLEGVSVTPGMLALGEGLGRRTSVSLTFRDHPHTDTGPAFDKYRADRDYDPFEQGWFWAKFIKRHPNVRGKRLRVIQGYVGQSLGEMETRHYEIDSASGPGLDGKFTITAKDPLKILDDDRAVAPAPSNGYLVADINDSVTSLTLAPAGIGNAEYPASGYVSIGGAEICAFTRSGNTLTITRGQHGKAAVAHKAGDRVQLCLGYSSADASEIIEDLMTTYGRLDPSMILLPDWQVEVAAYNPQVFTALIAEPTPVRKLVAELVQQAGLAIWWDDINQQVRLQVMRAISSDAALIDERHFLAGSLDVKTNSDKRYSRALVYFGLRSPLEPVDRPTSYLGGEYPIETDYEADYGPKTLTMFSRWIPAGGRAVAERAAQIQLGRRLTPTREFSFSLPRDGVTNLPAMGAALRISAPNLQADDGSREIVPVQVTGIKPEPGKVTVYAEEMRMVELGTTDPYNRTVTIDYDARGLNLRAQHDAIYGAPVVGGKVQFTVTSLATVGSTAYALAAIESGSWPTVSKTGNRTSGSATLTGIASTAGLEVGMRVRGTGIPAGAHIASIVPNTSITLDVNATSGSSTATVLTIQTTIVELYIDGKVIGPGGKGGKGGNGNGDLPGEAGQPGGTAMRFTSMVDVFVTATGQVKGGGGGGGGGGCRRHDPHKGGGGGGGAGIPPGPGGEGPGNAAEGSPGTATNGGIGGASWTDHGNFWDSPHLEYSQAHGGTGGNLASDGAAGKTNEGIIPAGPGGSKGYAIDGLSLIKLVNTGTISGLQGN